MRRRHFLIGAGGAALTLPFLEYFHPKASADETGCTRLIFCYSGQAMGGDGGRDARPFEPADTGRLSDLALPVSLLPLGGREIWTGRYVHPDEGEIVEPIRDWPGPVVDVRNRVTVVTGLDIPTTGTASASTYNHRGTVSPMLSGTTSVDSSPKCNGPTPDVIAEQTFGSAPTLRCQVQAGNYGNGGRHDNVLSWERRGDSMEPIAAQVSPRAMFQSLFGGGFAPPPTGMPTPDAPGPSAEEIQARALLRRRSVLDLVLPSARRLERRLGREDRARFSAHMDAIATLRNRILELEARLGMTPPPTDGEEPFMSACRAPMDPGPDPDYAGGSGGDGSEFRPGEGWSEEQLRAEAFVEMTVLAMACDLTRTASIMFSYHQSFMNAFQPTGIRSDQHQVGHFGGMANGSRNDAVGLCHHFPVRYFGHLVARMAETEVAPGRTLYDEAAMGLFFEAGHGAKEGGGTGSHSGENCSVLIAGGAGGLRMGEHIRLDGEHPAVVGASLLQAAGCEGQLGELSAHPELFDESAAS